MRRGRSTMGSNGCRKALDEASWLQLCVTSAYAEGGSMHIPAFCDINADVALAIKII